MKPKIIVLTYLSLVAPHTGAWIETPLTVTGLVISKVAPHTGAWIETSVGSRGIVG